MLAAITDLQWKSLRHLKRSDFFHPDKVDYSIVQAVDQFVQLIGKRPVVLSDYRAPRTGVKSRHPSGKAVDLYFAGVNPVELYDKARAFPLFDGVGVYVNQKGIASLHVDTTGVRTAWGGFITYAVDPDTGKAKKVIRYVTPTEVLNWIKARLPEIGGGAAVLLLVVVTYLFFSKR